MSWVAVAIAGSSIVGGAISANASSNAASQAANASNQATQSQLGMFNTVNSQGAPWRQAGQTALGAIGAGFGAPGSQYAPLTLQNFQDIQNAPGFDAVQRDPNWAQNGYQLYQNGQYGNDPQSALQTIQSHIDQGNAAIGSSGVNVGNIVQLQPQNSGIPQNYFTHQFGANDLNANLAPNYGFMLDQGQRATNNANNATGGVLSGNALQGLDTFTQNYASNAYQNALSNYTGQQTNIFNRLSSIAGLGQTANQTSATSGTQLGIGMANSQQNAGAAQAAGTIGTANALNSAVSGAGAYPFLSSIYGNGSQSGNNAIANMTMNPNVSTDYFQGAGSAPY